MDYEDKGYNNIVVLGVIALASMFFGYLIHSSKQTQPPIQQTSSLDNIQAQTQSLLETLANQSYQIEKVKSLSNTKQFETPVESVNVVSMPAKINKLNKDKLGFSDSSESIAASFGMA